MKKRKAFTLIEILIAVFIFVIGITVLMVSVVTVINSRSKIVAIKNNQEAGRLAVEMMANEVAKANGRGITGSLSTDYYRFVIIDSSTDNPASEVLGKAVGGKIKVVQSDGAEKIFQLADDNSSVWYPDGTCPSTTTCHLAMSTDGGISWSRVTSERTNLNELRFEGYYLTSIPATKQPYVKINMELANKQTDAKRSDESTFQTTAMPLDIYFSNLYSLGGYTWGFR